MEYDLGYFDSDTCRLEPIESPFAEKVLPMCPECPPLLLSFSATIDRTPGRIRLAGESLKSTRLVRPASLAA